MKYILYFLFLLSTFTTWAQDENLRYDDWVYKENIHTVQLHIDGLVLSYPIVDLNSRTQLMLSFDDFDEEVKDYTYEIVHCNADWQPSDLLPMEYTDGYTDADLDDYEFSFQTLTQYTHYWAIFPNDEVAFTKSGNYLLKVYDHINDKELAITRRFMVVEPIWRVEANMPKPAIVSKISTHQEIDFTVAHEDFDVRSPQTDVQAIILQNGRWDNALTDIRPQFDRQEKLQFDYQNKIIFPAGKEFRFADLRSLRYKRQGIFEVRRYDNGYDVTMQKEEKRYSQPYALINDINGKFVIENIDEDNHHIESDYASTLFVLQSNTEYYEQDVYLFGSFSDWQLKPAFKMLYNNQVNAYVGEPLLKQGFYNYYYVTVPQGTTDVDWEETEGNWFETQNEYTILIYFRPFGARYDRLVAAHTFLSQEF